MRHSNDINSNQNKKGDILNNENVAGEDHLLSRTGNVRRPKSVYQVANENSNYVNETSSSSVTEALKALHSKMWLEAITEEMKENEAFNDQDHIINILLIPEGY